MLGLPVLRLVQGCECPPSHDHTLGAAASLLVAIVHVHGLRCAVGASGTAAAGGVALHLSVKSPDLAHDIVEGLVNIDARFGGSLDELATERPRKSLAL